MSDIASGLIVAAATAAVVAMIFVWSGRAKRKKIAALQELCVRRGWKYERLSASLRHGHRIAGDGWEFEAVSSSSGREAGPGSSAWAHATAWRAAAEDPGRGTFILGSRLGGGPLDLSRLPPALLSRLLGEEVAGMRPFPPGGRLEARFVLFAREAPPAIGLLEGRSEDLLLAWPQRLPLVVRCSPARLSLTVLNFRLEKPAEVEAFIELGQSLLRS